MAAVVLPAVRPTGPAPSAMTELMTTLLPAVVLLLMTIRSLVASALTLPEVRLPPVMVVALAPTVEPTKMPPEVMVFAPESVKVSAPAVLKCSEFAVNAAGEPLTVTLMLVAEVEVAKASFM